MQSLLFVYGTLRKGDSNHFFLNGFECVNEQAWITGTLYNTGLGYPAASVEGERRVYGELYRIPEGQWDALHQLEGYDGSGTSLFVPEEVEVTTDSGTVHASVYTAGSDRLKQGIIPGGDWLRSQFEESKDETFLYFAYGSCMDKERMKEAAADVYFHEISGCLLKGYTLRFTVASKADGRGRADVVEEGGSCEGLLYRVHREGLDYLYKREGVFAGVYRPAIVSVTSADGTVFQNVLTFIVRDKLKAEIAPPEHYAGEILRGGKGWLSDVYLSRLEEHILTLQMTDSKKKEV
ncbi:gamma-glutamylcyclotransferase [Alteribacter natronophilus]|uniref:gamma-glutamylcyclotransferase n=1 Tax=Alteribacter natronophilus TaxID=2583810 RepID=UPI00110E2723|nr:gamma-glutamylcyclotransferase [Alteribacter natronophilus]TMW73493.1 gamma-glutamylcyclotransferase [Alteribacter natronophilus]